MYIHSCILSYVKFKLTIKKLQSKKIRAFLKKNGIYVWKKNGRCKIYDL